MSDSIPSLASNGHVVQHNPYRTQPTGSPSSSAPRPVTGMGSIRIGSPPSTYSHSPYGSAFHSSPIARESSMLSSHPDGSEAHTANSPTYPNVQPRYRLQSPNTKNPDHRMTGSFPTSPPTTMQGNGPLASRSDSFMEAGSSLSVGSETVYPPHGYPTHQQQQLQSGSNMYGSGYPPSNFLIPPAIATTSSGTAGSSGYYPPGALSGTTPRGNSARGTSPLPSQSSTSIPINVGSHGALSSPTSIPASSPVYPNGPMSVDVFRGSNHSIRRESSPSMGMLSPGNSSPLATGSGRLYGASGSQRYARPPQYGGNSTSGDSSLHIPNGRDRASSSMMYTDAVGHVFPPGVAFTDTPHHGSAPPSGGLATANFTRPRAVAVHPGVEDGSSHMSSQHYSPMFHGQGASYSRNSRGNTTAVSSGGGGGSQSRGNSYKNHTLLGDQSQSSKQGRRQGKSAPPIKETAASQTGDDSSSLASGSSASSVRDDIPLCPNDEGCQQINDQRHQRKYAHTCRLFPCYHGHIPRHAKLFRHAAGQITGSATALPSGNKDGEESTRTRNRQSTDALASVNFSSISPSAPNAVRVYVCHKDRRFEIYGDWQNVKVHTLKRYLHQVFKIPPRSQVIFLESRGKEVSPSDPSTAADGAAEDSLSPNTNIGGNELVASEAKRPAKQTSAAAYSDPTDLDALINGGDTKNSPSDDVPQISLGTAASSVECADALALEIEMDDELMTVGEYGVGEGAQMRMKDKAESDLSRIPLDEL